MLLIEGNMNEELKYEEVPFRIIDTMDQVLRWKTILHVNVKWSNHSEREAILELKEKMCKQYPHLFRDKRAQVLRMKLLIRRNDLKKQFIFKFYSPIIENWASSFPVIFDNRNHDLWQLKPFSNLPKSCCIIAALIPYLTPPPTYKYMGLSFLIGNTPLFLSKSMC